MLKSIIHKIHSLYFLYNGFAKILSSILTLPHMSKCITFIYFIIQLAYFIYQVFFYRDNPFYYNTILKKSNGYKESKFSV